MASGIFAVLDDIAALMDDVAVASKIAAQKTAGILGDDLAVNAEQATGFVASREIPVLWAITKGSFVNKLIIIPLALILNIFFPLAIKIALIAGGLYLAYEGAEKIIEYLFHRKERQTRVESLDTPVTEDPNAEKVKVKAAITTDFILSIEIVIIALGTVLDKPLAVQIFTVFLIATLATVGVYGLVALVVRMDDLGYWFIRKSSKLAGLGKVLIKSLPIIIKLFAIVGTVALLVVSGGIFMHNIEAIHDRFAEWPLLLAETSLGLAIGFVAAGIVGLVKKVIGG